MHYEVMVYTDQEHRMGQVVAITPDQDHAAEIADNLRSAGYTDVDVKRFGGLAQDE